MNGGWSNQKMKLRKTAVEAALVLFLSASSIFAAATADESYFAAKQMIEQGDALRAEGKTADARQKSEAAQKDLKGFYTSYPGWNNRMVQYRLDEVQQKLNRLDQTPGKAATIPAPGKNPPSKAEAPGQKE